MCPSRTFLLVAVLGCNIVLFVYNFPGLVGVVRQLLQAPVPVRVRRWSLHRRPLQLPA